MFNNEIPLPLDCKFGQGKKLPVLYTATPVCLPHSRSGINVCDGNVQSMGNNIYCFQNPPAEHPVHPVGNALGGR